MAWTPLVSPGAPTGREGRTSSRAPPHASRRLALEPCSPSGLLAFPWTYPYAACPAAAAAAWACARVGARSSSSSSCSSTGFWTSSASGAGLRSPRRRRLGCRPRRRRSWAWPQLRRKILGRPSPCPVASSRSCRASCPRTGRPQTSEARAPSLRDASLSRSADCWSAAEEEEEFSTEVDDFSTDSCCNARSFSPSTPAPRRPPSWTPG